MPRFVRLDVRCGRGRWVAATQPANWSPLANHRRFGGTRPSTQSPETPTIEIQIVASPCVTLKEKCENRNKVLASGAKIAHIERMKGTILYRGENENTLPDAPNGRWWSVDPLYAREYLGADRELLEREFDFDRFCDLRECLSEDGTVRVDDFNAFLVANGVSIPENLRDGGTDLIDSFVIQEFLDWDGAAFAAAGFEAVIHAEHGNMEEPAVLIF